MAAAAAHGAAAVAAAARPIAEDNRPDDIDCSNQQVAAAGQDQGYSDGNNAAGVHRVLAKKTSSPIPR